MGYGVLWDMGCHGMWGSMEPYGALKNPVGRYGTLWGAMEPYGAL